MAVKSWVHVASAARQAVEASQSQRTSQSAESPATSGPALTTSPKSSGSGVMPSSARLVLPWPPSELTPNFHGKRKLMFRAKKAYFEACWKTALEAKVHLRQWPDPLPVRITLCDPTGRVARDDDNAKAAFKHGRDAVAKAARVDDGRWKAEYQTGERCKGGAVILEINPQSGECLP